MLLWTPNLATFSSLAQCLHSFIQQMSIEFLRVFSRSVTSDSVIPWTGARQALLSLKFSSQEYWSELSFPTPGYLSNPGLKPVSLAFPALAGRFFTTRST